MINVLKSALGKFLFGPSKEKKLVDALVSVDSTLDNTARWLYSYKIAIESMDIYPKGHSRNGGEIVARTEKEEGWNEAVIECTKRVSTIRRTLEASGLKREKAGNLYKLIDDGIINISVHENGHVSLGIILNDVFMLASSDEETIGFDDVELVYNLYSEYGHHGVIAYVSEKRKRLPVINLITSRFREAKKYIKASGLLIK